MMFEYIPARRISFLVLRPLPACPVGAARHSPGIFTPLAVPSLIVFPIHRSGLSSPASAPQIASDRFAAPIPT